MADNLITKIREGWVPPDRQYLKESNPGHAGRPGQKGGSAPGGGSPLALSNPAAIGKANNTPIENPFEKDRIRREAEEKNYRRKEYIHDGSGTPGLKGTKVRHSYNKVTKQHLVTHETPGARIKTGTGYEGPDQDKAFAALKQYGVPNPESLED